MKKTPIDINIPAYIDDGMADKFPEWLTSEITTTFNRVQEEAFFKKPPSEERDILLVAFALARGFGFGLGCSEAQRREILKQRASGAAHDN